MALGFNLLFINLALALLVTALQVADVVTTKNAIDAGASEGNPVAAFFMKFLPPSLWIVPKIIPVATAFGLVWIGGYPATVMLGLVAAFYTYVVVHNYRLAS